LAGGPRFPLEASAAFGDRFLACRAFRVHHAGGNDQAYGDPNESHGVDDDPDDRVRLGGGPRPAALSDERE
jgi:hypothetical protein